MDMVRYQLNIYVLTAVAVILGLVIPLPVIALSGINPIESYGAVFRILARDPLTVFDTLVYATPLMLIGAGLFIAFKANYWNIGAEGQMWIGALIATVIALNLEAPGYIIIPLLMVVSFLGGVGWAIVPALLKVKYNVNEVLTTLLLNPVAVLIVDALLCGPLKDPKFLFNQTKLIPRSAWLPTIIPGTRVSAGLIIAIAGILVAYVIMDKTILGYRIYCVGSSPQASRYAGIDISKVTLLAAIISGGLSGLSGMALLCGVHFRLLRGFSPGGLMMGFWGYGFLGIAVALLAGYRVLATAGTSLIFGFLTYLSYLMEISSGISRHFMMVIEGITLLLVISLIRLVGEKV